MSLNVTYLTVLVTPLTLHWLQIRAIKSPKRIKSCLTWYLLFGSFKWGQNLVLNQCQICFTVFFRKKKYIQAQISLFLTNLALNKHVKPSETFEDNHLLITLRLFDVWWNFVFNSSETICDCYLHLLSSVRYLLKTVVGNKYFLNYCLSKPFFDCNLSQTS